MRWGAFAFTAQYATFSTEVRSMGHTIQDVAEAAGVSTSTVSRAFTRPDLVSAKTRDRILSIAAQMHFSLSRSAAALKSGKSLREEFKSNLKRGIEQVDVNIGLWKSIRNKIDPVRYEEVLESLYKEQRDTKVFYQAALNFFSQYW